MLNIKNAPQSQHFDILSNQWWNENGAFRALHEMNPLRIKYIKSIVAKYFDKKEFKELNILDVGCGGGLLCEPMARMGGTVTGIDASFEAIACAIKHSNSSNININYINDNIDNINEKYDLITCFEMLEHVDNFEIICKQMMKCLNDKGILILSTINQTLASYAFAILGAEYLAGVVPVGTHEWKKFIKPSQLCEIFERNNFKVLDMRGLNYSLLKRSWNYSNNLSINYVICFYKY